jgi:hypothetical protein
MTPVLSLGPVPVRDPVSVAVAVIVAVDIAGAATPELRHPCRSPCPETRK